MAGLRTILGCVGRLGGDGRQEPPQRQRQGLTGRWEQCENPWQLQGREEQSVWRRCRVAISQPPSMCLLQS